MLRASSRDMHVLVHGIRGGENLFMEISTRSPQASTEDCYQDSHLSYTIPFTQQTHLHHHEKTFWSLCFSRVHS
jgi:hypothetical protein